MGHRNAALAPVPFRAASGVSGRIVRPPRRVALLEPQGDPGIGTYTYELARGLEANGVAADIFTGPQATIRSLPRRQGRIYPVLGGSLLRQRGEVSGDGAAPIEDGPPVPAASSDPPDPVSGASPERLRGSYRALELAIWLRWRGYDLAWTQWPDLGGGWVSFWQAARRIGLPVIHTAHNILPHEPEGDDRARYGAVYRDSRAVLVHSEAARRDLVSFTPSVADKVLVSPLGLYTAYARRPAGREETRRRWMVGPDTRVLLFFGGVRPYKNVDSVVEALGADSSGRFVLVVAGHEFGYPPDATASPGDLLARTRALVARHGAQERVRLVPGPFGYRETSDIFEASDVVVMPYLESSGSGQLFLAMAFERFVIATRAGGMDEHLSQYPAHVLLAGGTAADVREGLARADRMLSAGGVVAARPAHLEWPRIIGELLPRIAPYC